MEITLFDDGDYRIYVFHAMGHDERKQVVYDPNSGVVRWQHLKPDPTHSPPDPADLSPGEERVFEQEFIFNEERELTTFDSPIE